MLQHGAYRQVAVLAFIWMFSVVQANYGPAYSLALACQGDWDCDQQEAHEVCWWRFDGCHLGGCMCNPHTHIRAPDGSGKCEKKIRGGDACPEDGVCPSGMSCQQGTCTCRHGELTPDRLFCKQSRQKLLGEACSPFYNTCIQKAAPGLSQYPYTDTNTACTSRGRCDCVEGFKPHGLFCVRYSLGDSGCSQPHHCQGGALCYDRTCVCPQGYQPIAEGTKCGKIGAVTDLAIRQSCDELNERRYCAHGLVCHKCAGRDHFTCVKYIEVTESEPHYGAVSRSAMKPTATVIAIVAALLCIRTLSWLQKWFCRD